MSDFPPQPTKTNDEFQSQKSQILVLICETHRRSVYLSPRNIFNTLVGNVNRATRVSSKLQSIWSDQYVFCFFWKNFIFFVRTKFIWGIWDMNGQYSWQILALVSFIKLIKVRCNFKSEKHRYFAVPNQRGDRGCQLRLRGSARICGRADRGLRADN